MKKWAWLVLGLFLVSGLSIAAISGFSENSPNTNTKEETKTQDNGRDDGSDDDNGRQDGDVPRPDGEYKVNKLMPIGGIGGGKGEQEGKSWDF